MLNMKANANASESRKNRLARLSYWSSVTDDHRWPIYSNFSKHLWRI